MVVHNVKSTPIDHQPSTLREHVEYAHVAENKKHIPTPKKKVEKTTISARLAVSYRRCNWR